MLSLLVKQAPDIIPAIIVILKDTFSFLISLKLYEPFIIFIKPIKGNTIIISIYSLYSTK